MFRMAPKYGKTMGKKIRDAMPADLVKEVDLKRKDLLKLRQRLCHLKRVLLRSQSRERQVECDEEMSSLETRIAALEEDIAKIFQVAAKVQVDAAEATGSKIDDSLDAAAREVQVARDERLTQMQDHGKLQAIVEASVVEAPEAVEQPGSSSQDASGSQHASGSQDASGSQHASGSQVDFMRSLTDPRVSSTFENLYEHGTLEHALTNRLIGAEPDVEGEAELVAMLKDPRNAGAIEKSRGSNEICKAIMDKVFGDATEEAKVEPTEGIEEEQESDDSSHVFTPVLAEAPSAQIQAESMEVDQTGEGARHSAATTPTHGESQSDSESSEAPSSTSELAESPSTQIEPMQQSTSELAESPSTQIVPMQQSTSELAEERSDDDYSLVRFLYTMEEHIDMYNSTVGSADVDVGRLEQLFCYLQTDLAHAATQLTGVLTSKQFAGWGNALAEVTRLHNIVSADICFFKSKEQQEPPCDVLSVLGDRFLKGLFAYESLPCDAAQLPRDGDEVCYFYGGSLGDGMAVSRNPFADGDVRQGMHHAVVVNTYCGAMGEQYMEALQWGDKRGEPRVYKISRGLELQILATGGTMVFDEDVLVDYKYRKMYANGALRCTCKAIAAATQPYTQTSLHRQLELVPVPVQHHRFSSEELSALR